ncbi:MAG: hypothetical protein K2G58_04410, partial [Alistipes sp.]|nr:hypothetical protein [Alistipes sp.]
MDKKKIKPWRVNYTVSYVDKNAAREYRDLILPVLKNVALLRGIDCAIIREFPFYDAAFFEEHPTLREATADLVYFRSSPQTTIPLREFRKLLDHIFEEYRFGPVEVGAQLLKALPNYPFPDADSHSE